MACELYVTYCLLCFSRCSHSNSHREQSLSKHRLPFNHTELRRVSVRSTYRTRTTSSIWRTSLPVCMSKCTEPTHRCSRRQTYCRTSRTGSLQRITWVSISKRTRTFTWIGRTDQMVRILLLSIIRLSRSSKSSLTTESEGILGLLGKLITFERCVSTHSQVLF